MKKTFCRFISTIFLLAGIIIPVMAAPSADSPDISISAEVRSSGFVGEVFEYVVSLYSSSPDVSNVKLAQAPSMPGNLTSVRGVVQNSRPEKVDRKGKSLYRWTIERYFFIPKDAGKFNIGPSRYVVFIPYERIVNRGFWGNQRIIDYEEVSVECKGIDFKASALPAPKNGAAFSGCVGDFKIEGWFPPGRISPGRDAYVIFTISGYGSLENLKLPNIAKLFGNGCRLKEMEQDDNRSQRDGKLYTEITLTCLFTPEAHDFEINPLCIEFFSPSEKSYYSACSEALRWTGDHNEKKPSGKAANDIIAI